MDKSLKKLSRVELLEIMVGLSEDCEKLSAENARLKKMIAAQQQSQGRTKKSSQVQPQALPRTAKVGSIAEAALQANGYFEAAQRSADEYLREIKRLRDELAVRSAQSQGAGYTGQSNVQAQATLNEAQNQARQIVERAQAQAQAILNDARVRSSEVLARANQQSHSMLAQAQQQARSASVMTGVSSGDIPYAQSVPYAQPVSSGIAASSASSASPFMPSRTYAASAPVYAGGTAMSSASPGRTMELPITRSQARRQARGRG